MASNHSRSRTQQGLDESGIPLASGETIWMEGLNMALQNFKHDNPGVAIHDIHSIHSDEGEWRIGLRCGSVGISYARIVLNNGYWLEWVD